jgi:Protein of unknown function (DUF3604)
MPSNTAVPESFPQLQSAIYSSEMLEFEYARSALKLGLKLENELGVNPYKFGMIASTDAHTGLAAVEEDNGFLTAIGIRSDRSSD